MRFSILKSPVYSAVNWIEVEDIIECLEKCASGNAMLCQRLWSFDLFDSACSHTCIRWYIRCDDLLITVERGLAFTVMWLDIQISLQRALSQKILGLAAAAGQDVCFVTSSAIVFIQDLIFYWIWWIYGSLLNALASAIKGGTFYSLEVWSWSFQVCFT